MSGLSWLGLLGLHRIARSADLPLTAALDDALGTDRRTVATAKTPGPLRMLRIYRDYAHDTDISYGEYGKKNLLDIWRRPDLDRDGRARCCCRCRAADGRREANAGKHIRC